MCLKKLVVAVLCGCNYGAKLSNNAQMRNILSHIFTAGATKMDTHNASVSRNWSENGTL